VIALKVAALFILAFNRLFVMDEFAQLGWAKYVGDGLFHTVWPSKAVGFQLFITPAHLVGLNARSILLIGRMEMALLACGTLAIVYALARSLGQSRMRAAVVVLTLMSFSNFIERIFETRAEPLATFFGTAALLVAVRAEDRRRRIVGAGVLGGLAFLSTQKAIYFDLALGLALVGDAALARRFGKVIACGAWLVLGWLIPVALYCFVFGGSHPLAVAQNLVFGPVQVASAQTAAEYGGLRHFVGQTLIRNALLYAFCFAGMIIALLRIIRLEPARRIALIFSIVVTALVFAHNQPWPYVFVMALPFMALWALCPFDALAGRPRLYTNVALAVLAIAIAVSFVKNAFYLRLDNQAQLAVVERAEKLLGPGDVYFDAIGMLPNRREPSTLWLDRHSILETLREGKESEAYRIFARSPPKLIIWSYRMDAIAPLVGPLIRRSYVQVAPNIRIAGVQLRRGASGAVFEVPVAGKYALYDLAGSPVGGQLEVYGVVTGQPLDLRRGKVTVRLRSGSMEALLLPVGSYAGLFAAGRDDRALFEGVYS
jgi:hypothetical protein